VASCPVWSSVSLLEAWLQKQLIGYIIRDHPHDLANDLQKPGTHFSKHESYDDAEQWWFLWWFITTNDFQQKWDMIPNDQWHRKMIRNHIEIMINKG